VLQQSRGKVLVVDDDPIVLQAVADCLTAAGFEVMSRQQALGTSQWIAQHDVDIILLDLMMPAMSGVDLATFLKKRGLTRKLSVILHSSKRAVELGPLVRQTGALGAIAKTDDTLSFLAEFERLADRHFRTKEGVEATKKNGKP
jgi:DNA-binding response OmpR family regulator